jgi:hypothetical protein
VTSNAFSETLSKEDIVLCHSLYLHGTPSNEAVLELYTVGSVVIAE